MEKIKHYFFMIKDNLSHMFANYRAQSPERFKKVTYTLAITMFLIFAGITIYLLFIKKHASDEQKDSLIQVKAIKVVKQDYTEKYDNTGTIRGATENDMRFEIEGYLDNYNYKEGDFIPQGNFICSLDPKDALTKADYAQSKYTKERNAFNAAQERYKVFEQLFKDKALAESKLTEAKFEIDAAEANVKAARSEHELAQSNLKKANLAAPSDGMLAQIIIKPGEYITPQDVVCKFISSDGRNLEVDIPEKEIQRLAVGQIAKIFSDSYRGMEFDGVLSEISPVVSPRTRTFTVKIRVENEKGELPSGGFGRVVIHLKVLKNVVLVPSDSVISLNSTTFLVPVVVPDSRTPGQGIIQMRPCAIGDKVKGDRTVVLEGLNIGELVVSETQGQLSDGIEVKFLEVTPDEEEAAAAAVDY